MRARDPFHVLRQLRPVALAAALLLLPGLAGCRPSIAQLEALDYRPAPGGDWPVSTPAAEGLDSLKVAELYWHAARARTTRAVLVVKNGRLVAEQYFHGASATEKGRLQSVTKSFTSALAGIALERGCLTSLDQRMMEFFPELASRVRDPRKNQITIRELLQMRAGYPWEESNPQLFELLYHGFRSSTLLDVPLVRDPGTGMEYSNLSSHLLGIVVARACSTSLMALASESLFEPLGIEPGKWITDWEGHFNGHADLHLTPRDMAKFGLLYLDGGAWHGRQVVPADWVAQSLRTYSPDAWRYRIGPNFRDVGYGYQWWSADAGGQRFNFAWGHGGQQIALVKERNLVIVVTSDPLYGQHGGSPWGREKENLNLVGNFIASLSKS
jgi:CubicO group peptidase (beta-lactamase class C family)